MKHDATSGFEPNYSKYLRLASQKSIDVTTIYNLVAKLISLPNGLLYRSDLAGVPGFPVTTYIAYYEVPVIASAYR